MTATPEPGSRDERPRCSAVIWPSSWSGWGQCPGHVKADGTCTAYGTQHRSAAAAAQPTGGEAERDKFRRSVAALSGLREQEIRELGDVAPSAGQDTGQKE